MSVVLTLRLSWYFSVCDALITGSLYGYELVLWHWDVIENTWLFRATREYPVSKTVSRKQALEQALYDAEELARIFQCKNYGTNEEGMWGGRE